VPSEKSQPWLALVIARLVVVALVEVELVMSRLVIVEEAELMRTPSPACRGERKRPPSVQLDEPAPPPIQVPFTAQQPPVRLTPMAKEEVAAEEEYRAFEIVVDALVMEKRVEVAYASEEEPISKFPATDLKVQCFWLVPPFVSVRVI
jgi:hypothetical protein